MGLRCWPSLPGSSPDLDFPGQEPANCTTGAIAPIPTRRVTSPYVSIEQQLASQQNIEMFTVVAERPAYWRLAGLDGFTGSVWSTQGNFEERSGDLPGATLTAGTTEFLEQTFTITALDQIWLPAAFAPNQLIDTGDATVTWNAEISSLTVDNDRPDSDGLTYRLQSVLPLFTPDELRSAPAVADRELRDRYTALPSDITPRLAAEAQRLTSGLATDYDKMLALQTEFRSYDYSLELSPRFGDPIEQFLDERVGFCQQFSGTFAAMARSLGIPARVAVGFTWGDPVDGETDTYRVTGRHAHAWPEVYFEGLGWVAFEPTPGRGAPGADYTGLEAQQDSPVQAQPTTPTTIDPAAPLPPTDFNLDLLPDPDFDTGGEIPTPVDEGVGIPWRVVGTIAALTAYGLAMPALARLRRARRWAAASTPADQIEAIWANVVEDLERLLGVSRPAALTRREWTERLIKDRRLPEDPTRRLGESVTNARFAPADSLDSTSVAAASSDAQAIIDILHQRVPAFRRWLRLLDPRWLWRGTPRRAIVIANS